MIPRPRISDLKSYKTHFWTLRLKKNGKRLRFALVVFPTRKELRTVCHDLSQKEGLDSLWGFVVGPMRDHRHNGRKLTAVVHLFKDGCRAAIIVHELGHVLFRAIQTKGMTEELACELLERCYHEISKMMWKWGIWK